MQEHDPFIVFDEQDQVLKFYVQSDIEYRPFGILAQPPEHRQGYFGFALAVKTMESFRTSLGNRKDTIVIAVKDIQFIQNHYGMSFFFLVDDEECSVDIFSKDNESFYLRLYRPCHEIIQVAFPSSFRKSFENVFHRAKECWGL